MTVDVCPDGFAVFSDNDLNVCFRSFVIMLPIAVVVLAHKVRQVRVFLRQRRRFLIDPLGANRVSWNRPHLASHSRVPALDGLTNWHLLSFYCKILGYMLLAGLALASAILCDGPPVFSAAWCAVCLAWVARGFHAWIIRLGISFDAAMGEATGESSTDWFMLLLLCGARVSVCCPCERRCARAPGQAREEKSRC
jgi:hypothetical protein